MITEKCSLLFFVEKILDGKMYFFIFGKIVLNRKGDTVCTMSPIFN